MLFAEAVFLTPRVCGVFVLPAVHGRQQPAKNSAPKGRPAKEPEAPSPKGTGGKAPPKAAAAKKK